MDFRAAKSIGADIEADYEQLKIAGGYDHNYVLNNSNGTLRKIAEVTEPESGRRMEVFSDAVGVQFYAGNFVESIPKEKKVSFIRNAPVSALKHRDSRMQHITRRFRLPYCVPVRNTKRQPFTIFQQ